MADLLRPAPVKNPPETAVKTSHGLQIVVNGKVIGAITSWSPDAKTRGMTHIYELNYETSGHPVDIVPGNLGGFTIRVNRYDLWKDRFEEVFGGISVEEALGDQDRPFEVRQVMKRPDGTKEVYVYRGCWMSSVGRTYSATGDRIVMVSATLTYLEKVRIA